MQDYPETVIEVLDDGMRFPANVMKALASFAKSNPWRGSLSARKEKFRKLNHNLSVCYDIMPPDLQFRSLDGGSSGGSYYHSSAHRIVLTGRLSVVTMLHEWGHVLRMGERDACAWSLNLFRLIFPQQYSRLIHVGHTVILANPPASSSRTEPE